MNQVMTSTSRQQKSDDAFAQFARRADQRRRDQEDLPVFDLHRVAAAAFAEQEIEH